MSFCEAIAQFVGTVVQRLELRVGENVAVLVQLPQRINVYKLRTVRNRIAYR